MKLEDICKDLDIDHIDASSPIDLFELHGKMIYDRKHYYAFVSIKDCQNGKVIGKKVPIVYVEESL